MKLSQIKLSGFKSFAKPTTIHIKGNLIGIVGPNGCGKSNIIDSIRWVLGESSAKQLRGDSMQDVIFSGSISHRSLSRATVELIFDNSQHELSGLWNSYQEISIKRLISRQGDSNYYINNNPARKKDITDLFLGTGVGTRGYAVIEQGMISKIIEAKPEELKMYLEEAAGVSKYRERRKDTVSRLDNTKNNLIRLNDIQSELIKQLEYLEKESAVAEQHQNLNLQLQQNKILLLLIKIDKTCDIITKIQQKHHNNQKELDKITIELDKSKQLITQEINFKTQEEVNLSLLNEEFNKLRANLARLEERELNNSQLIKRLIEDNEQIETNLKLLDDEITHLSSNLTTISRQTNNLMDNIEDQKTIQQQHTKNFSHLEHEYNKVKHDYIHHLEQINTTKHELSLLNNSLGHKSQQNSSLLTRKHRLELEISNNVLALDQEYFELKEQIDLLTLKVKDLENKLTRAKQDFHQAQENKMAALNTVNLLKANFAELSSKISTIKELLAKTQNEQNLKNIFGKDKQIKALWQGIEVQQNYEIAVESALGEILNSIKVNSNDIIDIKPNGKLSIWYTNNDSAITNKKSLANYVKVLDQDFINIYNILNQYQIANNVSDALELVNKTSESKLVTLDGHLITNSYIIFNPNSNNLNVLEYQNKLTSLEQEALNLDKQLKKAELDYAKTLELNINAQSFVTKLESEYNQSFKEHHQLNLRFTKEEQIHIQTKQHQAKISQELILLKQEIATLENDLINLNKQISNAQAKLLNLEADFDIKINEKDKLESKFNLAKSELNNLDNKLNKSVLELELLRQNIINTTNLLADKRLQYQNLQTSKTNNNNELEQLSKNQTTHTLNQARLDIEQMVLKIKKEEEVVTNLEQKINELNQQFKLNQDNQTRILSTINENKFKLQEQEILLKNHNESLSTFNTNNYDLKAMLNQNDLTGTQLQDCILDLEDKINQLGLVNLKAIEDLKVANQRNQDLLNQITDLNQAIEALEAIIIEIDGETKILLEATYNKVSEFFSHYFNILFGGGIAELKLISDDILNSGITIMAQPPGKKNSGISMLSGGEKALTAMSFVFALFYLNPAPFCVLDEVDAPLDDANTGNFCNLVQELSNKTQFIYISHNRLTMEMADQLVGITMQEKGVSTTISVNLSDIESLSN